MLKKKILLGMLVLGSCTACITQAVNFAPNETISYNGINITCDNNANCTTEINGESFLGLANGTTISQEAQVIFWREDSYIGYMRGNTRGAGSVRQAYQNAGCFANYTNATNLAQAVIDYLPTLEGNSTCVNNQSNANWTSRIENASNYAGKITSYTINFEGSQGAICYNYNEELGSFCFYVTSSSGRMPNADYGVTFPVTIEKINTVATTSPFVGGGGNEEQGNVGCMNIKTQIMMYGASYNTGLCYTSNKQWSGSLYTGERVTVTPKSIFEIFTGFDSYKERRNIYENSCHAPYTQEYCLARMNGNQYATEFFTKIDNAINNQGLTTVTAEKVYQYCHLQLNFTEEEKRETTKCQAEEDGTYYATGITAEGGNQNPIEGLTNIVLEEGSEIMLPNDGTVFDQILPEGIITRKDFALNVDNLKEALNIGRKFINLFVIREQKEGILPEYISSLILIFVFYQIIRRRTGN